MDQQQTRYERMAEERIALAVGGVWDAAFHAADSNPEVSTKGAGRVAHIAAAAFRAAMESELLEHHGMERGR